MQYRRINSFTELRLRHIFTLPHLEAAIIIYVITFFYWAKNKIRHLQTKFKFYPNQLIVLVALIVTGLSIYL